MSVKDMFDSKPDEGEIDILPFYLQKNETGYAEQKI